MRKHGIDNFDFEVIASDITEREEMFLLEKHYINVYDTYRNGYNGTLGGTGGDMTSCEGWIDSVRKYHSQKDISEYATCGMLGKKHSEETKLKQSEARRSFWEKCDRESISAKLRGSNNGMYGKTPSNAIPVVFNGVEYKSCAEAARLTGHSGRYVKKHGVLKHVSSGSPVV
jgi:hypothetical protein